jgi:hypothetical protein
VVRPPSRHATQPTSPLLERTARSPTEARRKAPVPYVHFASPVARQAWANNAACWSTASPATGSGRSPNAVVSPTGPAQGTISGRAAGSTPNSAQARSDHATRSRSSSSVREAVAASVTARPVMRCSSHASVVVTTPPSTPRSRSHAIFGAEK